MMKFNYTYVALTMGIDGVLLIPVIYFATQTRKLKSQLKKLGIFYDHPVFQIQYFAFVYFGFLTMSGLTKFVDRIL